MWKATIINQSLLTSSSGKYGKWSATKSTEALAQAWIDAQIGMPNRAINEITYSIENITAQVAAKTASKAALKFLNDTDYKVLRHQGQKALNIATTMTEQEYLALEQQRQAARQQVI